MATAIRIAESRDAWGTFDEVRLHLFDQFRDVRFVPETGLPLEDLEGEVESYLQAHPDQPKVLLKANVYRIIMKRGQIFVDPTDWFADKLNHGNILRKLTLGSYYEQKFSHGTWLDEAVAGPLVQGDAWFKQAIATGLARGPRAGLDLGHISPGWENMFAGGLAGLTRKAKQAREALGPDATGEQLAFYEAVEIVYDASIAFARRLATLAGEMVKDHPQHEERLRTIASACERVPAHQPQTFHEALQFVWLMHELIETEGENVRSMGHFDRILYPYYRADIDSGRLTREQAKELIKFFWFKWYSRTLGQKNGKNFVFAGQNADGSALANELTYLALEAYEELNTPDPKLSIRFVPESPDELYRRAADLLRNGHNSIVLMNDVPAVEALVRRGKALEDARTYLPIGCYEPAVDGKEAACTMNSTTNLAKPVELALNDGADPLSGKQIGPHTGDSRQFATFEQLMAAYTTQLDFVLNSIHQHVSTAERHWPQINPSPLIAATIDDCLVRGKDLGQGGPLYNTVGFVGAGLANASDSLLALKQVVFDEKRFTMDQVLDALKGNFEGQEQMRLYLQNRVAKWGTNDPEADEMAKRVADHFCNTVHGFTNARGGVCQAALFTLVYALSAGKLTGALPDGRKAHESLAPGVGSMYGRDKKGVTGLIGSVTKLDFNETPNGAVLDVTLHPTSLIGEEGLNALVTIIKTFFAQGGYAIQFNVFDVETLRDAQRHPERYASLQIRVTGWSVYFTSMSREEQDQFILRNIHSAA
jgi:formate C-acetyltransferase